MSTDTLPFSSEFVAALNGKRYFILTNTRAQGLGGRSWEEELVSEQDVPAQRLTIQCPSFHEGAGFTFAGAPNVYASAGFRPSGTETGGAWDASVPGKLGTWARHGTGTAVVASNTRGFLVAHGGSLYMCRDRYVTKYTINTTAGGTWSISGTDKDFGATKSVAGKPKSWNGKLHVPVQTTSSGVLDVFTEITTGSPDTYVPGPADKKARFFSKLKELLVRGEANGVATCATTPTVAANWSDDLGAGLYQVGDPAQNVTDAETWDLFLLVAKADGLWSLDDNFFARNELPDTEQWQASTNGVGMARSAADLFVPHEGGLIKWRPGQWRFIGPEQEGALEGALTPYGRPVDVIPNGDSFFVVCRDEVNQRGILLSFEQPRGNRGPYVPHMVVQTDGYFEGGCIVRATTGEVYLAVIRTNTAGTSAAPWLWRLPKAGVSVSNDSSIPHAVDNTSFFTPRYFAPSRALQKTYRSVEFWLEMSASGPLASSAGLQVWAKVDEGTAFQLLDSSGAAATLVANGAQTLYFPKTASAVGHYLQLEFRVPARGANTTVAIDAIRDLIIRASYRPTQTRKITALIVLGAGEHEDLTSMRRTWKAQWNDLKALAGPNSSAVTFKSPLDGREGWVTVERVRLREAQFPGNSDSVWLATVEMSEELYS